MASFLLHGRIAQSVTCHAAARVRAVHGLYKLSTIVKRCAVTSSRIRSADRRAVQLSCRLFSGESVDNDDTANAVDYYKLDPTDDSISYGDFSLMASQSETGRQFTLVSELENNGTVTCGESVWIRGRVSNVRMKGNAMFIIIRSGSFHTVQACHFKDKSDADNSKKMMLYAASLPLESIVDIMGIVQAADVRSCSVSSREIHIKKVAISTLRYH
jgi:lysyl-tRNA synthetase class II